MSRATSEAARISPPLPPAGEGRGGGASVASVPKAPVSWDIPAESQHPLTHASPGGRADIGVAHALAISLREKAAATGSY